jgi:hypothetical protein
VSGEKSVPASPVRGQAAVIRRGLALRFVLIIGDRRLAEAHHVCCEQDTVVVKFPETTVRIGLSPLPGPGEGVVLDCRVEYRHVTIGQHQTGRAGWQRVLSGRPGALHQREALLREVVAARGRAPGRTIVRTAPTSLRYLAAAV